MSHVITDDILSLSSKVKKLAFSEKKQKDSEYSKITVRPFASKKGTMWQLEKYKNNQVLDAGMNGYEVEIYKSMYNKKDGHLQNENFLYTFSYEARDSVVVKIQDKPATDTSESTTSTGTSTSTSTPSTSTPTSEPEDE